MARRVGPLKGRPHRSRRGSRGTRRRTRKGVSPVMGGPERVHGSEARAGLGLVPAATGIRGSDVLGDGVGRPRVAAMLPAGGTRGLDRTRGRARVRSRSTGGRLGFKAARRPSAKRGHPQGRRKSPRPACTSVRQASRGVREPFVPPGQRPIARSPLTPLSFLASGFSGVGTVFEAGARNGPGGSLARAAGSSIGTSEPSMSRPDNTARSRRATVRFPDDDLGSTGGPPRKSILGSSFNPLN